MGMRSAGLGAVLVLSTSLGGGWALAGSAEDAILATFAEIDKVPRCSKDEGRISAWLVDWAKNRKLEVTSDQNRNVVIRVPASPGWEGRPGIVLQSHMDMVCLKTDRSTHDFTRDPVQLVRDGDWIHAKDTTLGADDGLGVAIALTAADRPPKQHPQIELLFTTDEEKDMSGAAGLSSTVLTGRKFINLDSEKDSGVTLGAAGGVHTDIELPLEMSALPKGTRVFDLKVSGLLGGHSGIDINKNRANANQLAALLLSGPIPFRLIAMTGGNADNVIAASARVTVAVDAAQVKALRKRVAKSKAEFRAKFPKERGMVISLVEPTTAPKLAAPVKQSAAAMGLIAAIPQGVTAWSKEFRPLPETSNNIGIVGLKDGKLNIATFQRSFHPASMEEIAVHIAEIAKAAGASSSRKGAFPPWPPNDGTSLYKSVTGAYSKLYGSPMAAGVVHAGLECGYIASKYPGMEIVSIGPTLEDVHSIRERLKVSSVAKVWGLVQEVLQAE